MTGDGDFDARVRELFDATLELPTAARAALLEERCADDPRLRREVEALLEMASTKTGFLERPPAPLGRVAPAMPERIGPYVITGTLGQGGMGVVHRARDERDGRIVALKSILLRDATVLSAIRREVEVLSRLAHPGIVRILDAGTHDGMPWYVMELLAGPTLAAAARELVRRAGRVALGMDFFAGEDAVPTLGEPTGGIAPEPAPLPPAGGGVLPELMALLGRLADPLAHIHGEGLVHRDVKPGNVLVTDDGRVVLLDFGLAAFHPAAQPREVLQPVGVGVGTVAYMAPEQARGELVDARADIYALGCIAYELVTGAPPLMGPTAWATLARRQNEVPDAPSRFVSGVPAGLSELLQEMLAPSPEARIGHAEDVRARLHDLGLAPAPPAARGRAYLYRPRLAGRDDVVEELAAHLGDARAGRGGLLLLGGETGIGKTRLAMALAERARAAGAWVAEGDGSASDDGAPSHAVVRLVAETCREGGSGATHRILSPLGRALAVLVGELVEVPGFERLPAIDMPQGPDGKLLISVALTDAVLAIAERSPVLVVIDDLPLADEVTAAWLGYMARTRRLDDARVLVVATHRVEERHDAVEEVAAAGAARLQAGPLGAPAVAAMARDMLARTPPPEILAALATGAEGNPLFVAEYLRTAVEERLLSRDPAAGWQVVPGATLSSLATPRALEELLERHVALLPPHARELLAAASVLGRTADEELLARTAALADGDRLDAIQTLIARAFVDPGAGGALRFRHDGTRRVVYGALSEPDRRRRHASAAEAMAAAGAGPSETLALHRRRGGDDAAAGATYLEAARASSRRYELEAAGRCYREALALAAAAGLDRTAIIRELLDDVLFPLGRRQEARLLLAEALDLPWPDRGARGRALLVMSPLLFPDDAAAALQAATDALEEFRDLGDRGEQARALSVLALTQSRIGNAEEAGLLGEAAVALLPQARDVVRAGETMVMLGNLAWERGRLPAARVHYGRAVAAFESAGDVRHQATTLVSLGAVEGALGELHAVAEHLGAAVDLLHRVGNRNALGTALMNLGSLRFERQQLEEALALYEEAAPVLRDVDDRTGEALARSLAGALLARAGRTAEARARFAAAAGLLRNVDDPRRGGAALSVLAESVASVGDAVEAAELSRRAIELLSAHGAPADLAMALCREGHLRLARGEPARPLLEEIDLLLARDGVVPTGDLAVAIESLRAVASAS